MVESAGMRVLLDLEDAAPDVLFEQVGATGAYFWPLARWPEESVRQVAGRAEQRAVDDLGHLWSRGARR